MVRVGENYLTWPRGLSAYFWPKARLYAVVFRQCDLKLGFSNTILKSFRYTKTPKLQGLRELFCILTQHVLPFTLLTKTWLRLIFFFFCFFMFLFKISASYLMEAPISSALSPRVPTPDVNEYESSSLNRACNLETLL